MQTFVFIATGKGNPYLLILTQTLANGFPQYILTEKNPLLSLSLAQSPANVLSLVLSIDHYSSYLMLSNSSKQTLFMALSAFHICLIYPYHSLIFSPIPRCTHVYLTRCLPESYALKVLSPGEHFLLLAKQTATPQKRKYKATCKLLLFLDSCTF